MSVKRSIFIWSSIVLLILIFLGILFPAVSAYRAKAEEQAIFKAVRALPLDRLRLALETYAHTQKTNGHTISEFVTMQELVSKSYLRPEEVGVLNQRETFVSTEMSEIKPSAVLLRVSERGYSFVMLQGGAFEERRDPIRE